MSGTTGNNDTKIDKIFKYDKNIYREIAATLNETMSYKTIEIALSKPRIERYLIACNGNKRKALKLHRLNIRLSQSFYSLIGLFEVTLRNAIDDHYKTVLADNEWLVNSTSSTGMFSDAVFPEVVLKQERR